MIYDQLPVYKTVYDLLMQVYQWSRNLSKDYRYTLGESLKKELMNLLISIYQANATFNKSAVLSKAREQHIAIKLQIRLLADLHQISLKQYATAAIAIESISKQLAGWQKSVEKSMNK